jgi:uncharacterized protein YcbX
MIASKMTESRDVYVESLHVYPLKSARGIDLDRARLSPRGLIGDREWMIITAAGRFVTQRSHPVLAQLIALPRDGGVRLEHPRIGKLELDAPAVLSPRIGVTRHVMVWKREIEACDAGEEAADYASRLLGEPARIVAAGSDNFPDGYPLLVCTRESLADLNAKLPTALPMNRFRPNVVISGTEAFAEDRIRVLRIGDVHLRLVKPCTRCGVTGLDQTTGRKGLSPLRVLQEFRFDPHLRGVTFGQNAKVAAGAGAMLQVGARVEIEWR